MRLCTCGGNGTHHWSCPIADEPGMGESYPNVETPWWIVLGCDPPGYRDDEPTEEDIAAMHAENLRDIEAGKIDYCATCGEVIWDYWSNVHKECGDFTTTETNWSRAAHYNSRWLTSGEEDDIDDPFAE